MSVAIDGNQRIRLERLVTGARRLLEDDLSDQAAGRFGIDLDGTIADEVALRLDPSALAQRREIVEVVEHLRSEGIDAAGAVNRLLREVTFTHLNRLIAIRIAEALGLLPPSLANGRSSQGFLDLLELAPLLAGDATGGYWTYLKLCGDELAGDVPTLFDPRNPLLALTPSPGALDRLVELLSNPSAAELWKAPDCLGWSYQFFNQKEERDAMREESSSPRDSRELAVRNQFFTPRYVVDFLVQNTLGRRLVESDPSTPLARELRLLVGKRLEQGSTVNLHDVAVLDPAVGSGHFLLGAYDLLERAWELAGVSPAESAPQIVRSLWGVDIDSRAAQVASTAVMFRARRHCRTASLPRPNIITARSLPIGPEGLPPDGSLTARQRETLDELVNVLARAPELGSLLKVEDEFDAEIRHGGFGRTEVPNGQGVFQLTGEAFAKEEEALLAALRRVAHDTTASAPERLFAAEADDALRFVDAMRRRYDVVVMNPPFGEPIGDTKSYLKAAYPWSPSGIDLLAAFVGRGLELCKPDGYVGAITNRAGLFISTFKEWRQQVILANRFITMVDLGYRVMAQAKVEAAAYVVGKHPARADDQATFIRLLKDSDKATAVAVAVAHHQDGESDERLYTVRLSELHLVPNAPIAYAMSPAIRRLFSDLARVGAPGTEVRVGLQTGDDARFVRAFWEVDPRRIARTKLETQHGGRWAPFAKGGDYGQYWSDIHLVVDYERDGERLRNYSGARVQNAEFYFLPGLTWPRRTNSAMSVRVLPAGCVFADKGPAVFSEHASALLAWLNSRYVRLLIDLTSAGADEDKTDVSRSYEVGTVKTLPNPTDSDTATRTRLASLAEKAARAVAARDESNEVSRRFLAPAALHVQAASLRVRARKVFNGELARALAIIEAHDDIDREVRRVVDPGGSADQALYDADGPLATDLPGTRPHPELLTQPLRQVVAETTARHGVARWIGLQHHVADRRLELAAVAENSTPKALVEALPDDLIPPEEPERTADDVLSYLVGVALGRWDVRIGREPQGAPPRPDVYAPVPLCPPGMLVGEDGFPAVSAPKGYPIDLPPGRILVDQPGQVWDVEAAIAGAAQALTDDGVGLIADLEATYGHSIRNQLRRHFFRDHVVRYSKSKRKAPIFWPLYVPSGLWGVWVYAPKLSRETLFAITRAAADRLDAADSEIRRLERERDRGGAGRPPREVANALASEQKLAEELRRFRDEAGRLAGLGWVPDLDDGIILCAAPLADLFPAWRDASAARTQIKAGRYRWATVSRWANKL